MFDEKNNPDPDSIDFCILKLMFKIIPNLFTAWANLCLSQNYLPLTLRQGKVVYFQKQAKNPSKFNAYRSICLLLTLGKIVEKLLVTRLVHNLELRNILHHRRYRFRDGRSCEKTLFNINNYNINNYMTATPLPSVKTWTLHLPCLPRRQRCI